VFEAGELLWAAGIPVSYALFPLRGVVSLQISPGDRKAVEVGLLGREGCAEVPCFLGGDRTQTTAVALTPGEAIVMQPDLFRTYLSDARFRRAMEAYVRMFLVMLSRISVCNRVHVIEKTLVGRLLLMQDRTQTDTFQLTQDFLSRVWSVRKATISRAAARIQKLGLIRYDRRGRLTIVDRRKLERQACSCYQAIRAESDRLIAALGGL
jgi:CRP-like cAMP-binding protein